MRVFLTGATGFIGRAATKALLAADHDVTALVRRPEGAEARQVQALGAKLAQGDVTDQTSMRAPMQDADAVIHNAGVYILGATAAVRRAMHAANIVGTEQTLGLAQDLGIRRIVYISSIVAFGPTGDDTAHDDSFQRRTVPSTYYEWTKTEAHAIAQRYIAAGAPLVNLCPGAVVGVDDHSEMGNLIRAYVRGLMPPILLAANYVRASVHVDDVAAAFVAALTRGEIGHSYFLSGGSPTYREQVEAITSVPGGMKPWFFTPRWLAAATFPPLGVLIRSLKGPNLMSAEMVRAAYTNYRYTGKATEENLGISFRPATQAIREATEGERARWQAQRQRPRTERRPGQL